MSRARPLTKASTAPSGVAIDLAAPCRDWRAALPGAGARCRRAARAALAAAAPQLAPQLGGAAGPSAEISLVLGDDAMLHRLNQAWRGKDGATNVLSFPAQSLTPGRPFATAAGLPLPLGDVVLAFETIRREADEQGKTLGDHLSHLVVHGVLHLLGFDHETGAEAEEMEGLERRVLAGLGIADPYVAPGAVSAALPGVMEPSHG